MSEQTILLDENDLLSLLNGGSFHTLVGNQKVVIKQSLLKPALAPMLNYRYQIVDTKQNVNVYQEWYHIQLIQILEEQ